MKILITGATGLIGCRLTEKLLSQSHQITVLSRDLRRAAERLGPQVMLWETLADQKSLNGFDAIINLAGEPIADKRWTDKQKKTLCDSRWQLTQRLTMLIQASEQPPSVFISGSAVGYYGDQGQAPVTEQTRPTTAFTGQLCAKWEALAEAAASDKTRVCLLRTGVVLAKEGGALSKMVTPFRLGAGGPIASGQQYMPWIHIDDMIAAIIFLLHNPAAKGAFNMTAPHPVQNQQFSKLLAQVLHRPALLRLPASVVRLLMGEAAMLVTEGQQAFPHRLVEAGFSFRYTHLKPALETVLRP